MGMRVWDSVSTVVPGFSSGWYKHEEEVVRWSCWPQGRWQ